MIEQCDVTLVTSLMPELPGEYVRWIVFVRERVSWPTFGPTDNSERLLEVERAAKFIRTTATGRKIARVETAEDTIVYTGGITHEQFVRIIARFPNLRLLYPSVMK